MKRTASTRVVRIVRLAQQAGIICTAIGLLLIAFENKTVSAQDPNNVELIVLGIAQDAGFPQAACQKDCCAAAWKDPKLRRHVVSLAVVDRATNQRWLFECTPDFRAQLSMLDEFAPSEKPQPGLDGIFLTHAHIGHYAGLIHLGREVIGANATPVYTMPRMGKFLTTNGPWSQLVSMKNISLMSLEKEKAIELNERISVTPFQVPHRDEFSETVGFKIAGPNKTVVFLPDIDKWAKWSQKINNVVQDCDVAYLDGTFFENGEIPGRDMSLIPHPFVAESIQQFSSLEKTDRAKVRFIHFNHTNPVLQPNSAAQHQVERAGLKVAVEGEIIKL